MSAPIPDSLTWADLTEEERHVLAYAYQRAKECQKPRYLRNHSGGIFFFAESPRQRAEKHLFELGLLARQKTGSNLSKYGYAVSYDGYDWCEAQARPSSAR